jgi:hypothetical protein
MYAYELWQFEHTFVNKVILSFVMYKLYIFNLLLFLNMYQMQFLVLIHTSVLYILYLLDLH